MIWIVGSLLAILLVTGIVRLILFFRSSTDLWVERRNPLGNRRLVALGIFNLTFAGLGLALLVTRRFDPLDILIGISLVELVFEVGFRKTSITLAQ